MSRIARVRVLGSRALGVPMKVMLRRGDRFSLELFRVDAKDARFLMIEPHDGLMSLHGRLESKARAKYGTVRQLVFHVRAGRACARFARDSGTGAPDHMKDDPSRRAEP